MGTEAVWVPLVMAAVAGGATYANNRSQAKKADKINSQALLKAGERQKRADARVNQLIDTTATSDSKDEKAGIMSGYLQQLQAAKGNSTAGLAATPAASSRYAQEATAAALGIEGAGQDYADLTSRLDAPILQRQGEGIERNRAGVDLQTIVREQEGEDAGTQLRLRGIRDNPWLLALASAAGSAGSGYSSAGGGTAKAAQGANSVGPVGTSVWSSMANYPNARYA